MRTRLAITGVFAIGLLMSGTGAGLALSGSSGDGSAGSAQYPQVQVPQEPPAQVPQGTPAPAPEQAEGKVLGQDEDGREPTEPGGPAPSAEDTEVQPTRQIAAPGDEDLPFTGWAAVPLLIAGICTLGVGIALRRGMRSEEPSAQG